MAQTEHDFRPKDRRSVRLKGHDYAGGGVCFVTVCAHREAIAARGGNPFAGELRALMEERLRITAEKFPQTRWGAWVMMPDHSHARVHMQKGALRLGDVSGDLPAAEARNRFVIQHADMLFTPHVTPGGMLDRLLNERP